MTDYIEQVLVVFGVCAMIICVLSILFTITFAFKRIAIVEAKIASPGKELDGIRKVWGGGPIGRWMRAGHVFLFFVVRKLPMCRGIAERLGDEKEPIPLSLKLWAILPIGCCLLSGLTFMVLGWPLGAYS